VKIDVSAIALDIGREVDRLWPRETPFGRGLALAEEAGEVCRAMLKRDHAEVAGTFKGLTPEEWTENLRVETFQAIGVLLDIARREGFDVEHGLAEAVWKLKRRPA
jgi:NTP pyrophosphatase (non-canonical NTP hydrolase)